MSAVESAAESTGIRYPFPSPPAEGEAIRIAEGVLWCRLPLPMALDHVNIYALEETDGWTVIDTGFDSRRARAIWARLLAGPLGGRPVRRVVVTHHHPDHIGLAGWFQTTQGAELVTTRSAWLLARMLHLDAEEVHKPETLAFWRASGMDPAIYATRAAERPFNYADVVAPLPLGYRRIAEGDALTMGGRRWRVHMGHGHAPEQATFWSCDDALVLGADQLLPSISPNLGVYASEPEADTVGDWLESCTRLAGFARPDQLVLPGHKLPFTGLPLRLAQLIDNHHGALARLLEHLAAPRRGGECFVPLFKREIGAESYGLALAETIGHLNHLHARGLVRRWRDAEGAWLWQRIAGA